MPYINERAERLGHVPVAANAAVREAMAEWRVAHAPTDDGMSVGDLCTPLEDLAEPLDSSKVRFALAVDGSDTEVEATREHPTVKAGYLRVAASMSNLDRLKAAGAGKYVDPRALRRAHDNTAFEQALPSTGLIHPGMTGVNSWRFDLDRFLRTTKFDDAAQMTLADVLLLIHGEPGAALTSVELGRCPNPHCGATDRDTNLAVGSAGGTCPSCDGQLFLADVFRTHEEYNPEGSNLGPLTRAMNVVERLVTIGCVETLYHQRVDTLAQTIFITDGPLALHGIVAPLKRRFGEYVSKLGAGCEERGYPALPLMVGVEKSGQFVEHAALIVDRIPEGHVMNLPTAYINRITGRDPANRYGTDEFYGRRFIYRTTSGDALVITVPPRPGVVPYEGAEGEDLASYPSLRPICEVLDRVRTRLYPNAVIPVALAHSSASLPLGIGHSVLRTLLQQALDLPVSSLPGYKPANPYVQTRTTR